MLAGCSDRPARAEPRADEHDEDDNGLRLATLVTARVAALYPDVHVQIFPKGEPDPALAEYHGCIVEFTSPRIGDLSLMLYANFDWSFQIDVNGITALEDVVMDEAEDARVDRLVAEIRSLAESGMAPIRSSMRWRKKANPWV